MIFKHHSLRLILRVALLFATSFTIAWVVLRLSPVYLIVLAPLLAWELVDFYRFNHKAQEEVGQFVESVHYRDFSRHFDVKHAPQELQPLRKGFNDINSTFKVISRERETQYQYLQKVLELVDTGILSYENKTGEVGWMNESLKKMLGIPYLKSIHSLEKRNGALYRELSLLMPGASKVVSIERESNATKVLLSATAFRTDDKVYKLVAFQNVNEALDETEAAAWQKLLSVLTHEIMNSIAPISSLADTMLNRLQHAGKPSGDPASAFEDLELGIETIRRRSEGLLRFADTYRNLNKITTPNVKRLYVSELFENIVQLMRPTLDQKSVALKILLPDPGLQLDADPNLLEQVLINLVLNSVEAVKDRLDPRITLSASLSPAGKLLIRVADNGSGIPPGLLDKIFVPFFSTRKSGSGIGLSLCKQIMMLHKGNIQVQSVENEGTAFVLNFP